MEKPSYDNIFSELNRLKELYADQQYIIECLIRNGNRHCVGNTTITYSLPLITTRSTTSEGARKHQRDLRALRQAKGLTLQQLSSILKVAYRTVQRWEVGLQEPSLDQLDYWAEALDAKAVLIIEPLNHTT